MGPGFKAVCAEREKEGEEKNYKSDPPSHGRGEGEEDDREREKRKDREEEEGSSYQMRLARRRD